MTQQLKPIKRFLTKKRTDLRAMVPNHLRVVGLERSSDLARPKVALKVK
jgi:hypothetical protein